jgi:hypothetical protein
MRPLPVVAFAPGRVYASFLFAGLGPTPGNQHACWVDGSFPRWLKQP